MAITYKVCNNEELFTTLETFRLFKHKTKCNVCGHVVSVIFYLILYNFQSGST